MATTTVHHFSPLAMRLLPRAPPAALGPRLGQAPAARQRDIGRYVVQRGGKFTDSLERDVERRFLFGGWPSASSSGRG